MKTWLALSVLFFGLSGSMAAVPAEMTTNFAYEGLADSATWEGIAAEVDRIKSSPGSLTSLTPEGFFINHEKSLAVIAGGLMTNWLLPSVKPAEGKLIPSTRITVDGAPHGSAWIVSGNVREATAPVEILSVIQLAPSVEAYLLGVRERFHSLLFKLLSAKQIEIDGVIVTSDRIILKGPTGKVNLAEAAKQFATYKDGGNTPAFNAAKNKILGSGFYRVVAPFQAGLESQILSYPSLLLAPSSLTTAEIKTRLGNFLKQFLRNDLQDALTASFEGITRRYFGPDANDLTTAKQSFVNQLKSSPASFHGADGYIRLLSSQYLNQGSLLMALAKSALPKAEFDALEWSFGAAAPGAVPKALDPEATKPKQTETPTVADTNPKPAAPKAKSGKDVNPNAPLVSGVPTADLVPKAAAPAPAAEANNGSRKETAPAPKDEYVPPPLGAKKAAAEKPKKASGSVFSNVTDKSDNSSDASSSYKTSEDASSVVESKGSYDSSYSSSSSTARTSAPAVTKDLPTIRKRLLQADGNPKTEFVGAEGLEREAHRYYRKDKDEAYAAAREALGAQLPRMQWKNPSERVKPSRADGLHDKLFSEGKAKSSYVGSTGLAKVASELYGKDVEIARKEIEDAIAPSLYGQLKYGKLNEKDHVKAQIFAADNKPLPQFKGALGLAKYSAEFEETMGGNMKTAQAKIKSLFPELYPSLKWEVSFDGKAKTFQQLRARVINDSQAAVPMYVGSKGCEKYAEQFSDKNQEKAKRSVRDMLTANEYGLLQWDEPQAAE